MDTDNQNQPTTTNTFFRWASRIGAVLVSAAIIYYCLRQVQWPKLKEAVAGANLALALFGSMLPLFVFWIADTAFTVKSFEWFFKPVRFRDYFVIKAAAYLLTLVNITFATGGVFIYFMRKTGITAREQAGLLFFRVFMAGLAGLTFVTLMILMVRATSSEVAEGLGIEIWGPLTLTLMVLALESTGFWFKGDGLILKRLSVNWESEFWTSFRLSRPKHWLQSFAYTMPPVVLNFVGMYLVARAFHLEIPFFYFMFWIPAALLFSALPIAFGQFGTTTLAWSFFFDQYGDPEAIVAATLFIPTVRIIWRGVIGGTFMPFAIRELEQIKSEDDQNQGAATIE